MRYGEIVGMEWERVDLSRGVIRPGLERDRHDGQQLLVVGVRARLQEPCLFVRLKPLDPAFRLSLQLDPRRLGEDPPLVTGEAEQMAQQRERPVDARGAAGR